MLNIKLGIDVHKGLCDLVYALSIGHVSKYPIDVVVKPDPRVLGGKSVTNDIYFVDSRFPIKDDDWGLDKVVACLMCNSGGDYVLKSKRIKNDKYGTYSDGYHMRRTSDPKKMLRMLKEYIKPFTEVEIARMGGNVESDVRHWAVAALTSFSDLTCELHGNEIVNEVLHLKSLGVEFRSEKFKRVAEQAGELRMEGKRREQFAADVINLYVYEQPDGLVSVTYLGNTRAKVYKGAQSWSYENMESVPEVIRQQLALLKLSEADNYIPEIGKRDQNGYWIHVTPDKFALPS